MPTDPVCGMFVPDSSDLTSLMDGHTLYFCSRACQQKYASPEIESLRLKRRLVIGWIFSLPIILINYLVPASLLIGSVSRDMMLFVLVLPVQFYSGTGFYEGAYHSIKSRMGNMDLLISLGTLTAFTFSTYITFFAGAIYGTGVYFDASAFIITLILSGNFIENITKEKANKSASKLLSLVPGTTHYINENGDVVDKNTGDIKEGDLVIVKPGESVPVDGIINDGKSEIDESMLTGEQEPVLREKGDEVSSGTLNINGTIWVKVSRVGRDSTVNKIYAMIQGAISGRAKVQRLADAFSMIFVPVVIVTSLISSLFWYLYLSMVGYGNPLEIAVLVFVSVIIIACPCAIGLAAPVTLLISSNQASESGIIIKNASALERLSKVNRAVFDKTGTLTEPEPIIVSIETSEGRTGDEVIGLAASVEAYSNHPIARAITAEAKARRISLQAVQTVTETPGAGISGKAGSDEIKISRAARKGGSAVSVNVNEENVGYINVSYKIRVGAKSIISQMKNLGITPVIITGDSIDAARQVGDELGIEEIHAEITPSGKAEIIKECQAKGDYVMFTGDGINDAVAMKTADVGVAMGSGTDIAMENGDIILLNNDLRLLLLTKIIGEKSTSKIRQNVGWAVGYNSILIPVAAGVLVPFLGLSIYSFLPILAALAMGMSSSSVVINSLNLRGGIKRSWDKAKISMQFYEHS